MCFSGDCLSESALRLTHVRTPWTFLFAVGIRAASLLTMRRRSGRKCIEMAKWFESARGGTESAREGTESAREGTESAREGTESAREGTESAREGTESAREGIESAREGTESAREGTESALVSLR